MKLFTTIFILLSSITVSGQVNKGTVLFGGDLGYNISEDNQFFNSAQVYSNETNRFFFNPKVGLFLSKSFALGLGFGIEEYKTTEKERVNFSTDQINISKSSITFINPFAKIQSRINDRLNFSLRAEFKMGGGDSRYTNTGVGDIVGEVKLFEFNLQPGLFYFISKKTAITMSYGSINYIDYEETVDLTPRGGRDVLIEDKDFNFNLGFESLRVGFMFVFIKKDK